MHSFRSWIALTLVLLGGCPTADIRPLDASRADAAEADAGSVDAGTVDSGAEDGGVDAGLPATDAGVDAGSVRFEANVVFVTSTAIAPAMMGGLAGADAECNTRAMLGGLPDVGNYRAWLSATGVNAISRLGSARGWVRTDGEPFADTTTDIEEGRILASPMLDEMGAERAVGVSTATASNGQLLDDTCGDWMTGGGDVRFGQTTDGRRRWTASSSRPCSLPTSIYCFGTARTVAVARREPMGRIAFRSFERVVGSVGRDAMDALCVREATRAGFGGRSFVALVSTSGQSASERLTDGAAWYRPDGVLVARDLGDITSEALRAPVVVTADLSEYGDDIIWSGATSPSLRSGARQDCEGWAVSAARGERGSTGRAHDFFADISDAVCTSEQYILCFEP